MSFGNGLGDRKDDLRFSHNPQPPHDDPPFLRHPSTLMNNGPRITPASQASDGRNDLRAGLARRFTTESARLPATMPTTQPQRVLAAEPLDLSTSTMHKVQLNQLEKKRLEYEVLREQRRRFEVEMQQIELRQQREEQEIAEMTEAIGQAQLTAGHQSEPTTPPTYRGSTFPSTVPQPNRYSASYMMFPPGFHTHGESSSSQFTMPSSSMTHPQTTPSKIPSKSVPGSRRNSDEKEAQTAYQEELHHPRPTAAYNRNSMPAVGLTFRAQHDGDHTSALSLGQINTTGFLFGDDDSEKQSTKKEQNSTASPDVKSYLQMNATDDKFPILVRRNDFPGLLSASSAALDLALSQSPGPESQSNGWPSTRHRPAQHSLPAFALQSTAPQVNESPGGIVHQTRVPSDDSPRRILRFERHSTESKLISYPESMEATPHGLASLGNGSQPTSPPKLQSSYSTNDIPTTKPTENVMGVGTGAAASTQQRFHNHNASLGRIPPGAANRAPIRDNVGVENAFANREGFGMISQPLRSALQANAPLFGPPISSTGSTVHTPSGANTPTITQYPNPGFYGNYGMPMMGMNLNNMHMGSQLYQPHTPFASYPMYGYYGRGADSKGGRAMQQRRLADGEANRFANVQLESLRGQIYPLCKDQHGCRYLQKKLDERTPDHIQMIFLETNQHVIELMTDPFGNYLCQKLLEYTNDEQRTVLVGNAAPQLTKIALSQHGTRALQKMIEFISTPEQIQIVIRALQSTVVELIQDLNGNHVIQKCLNRLTPADAQFIFDAVGANCVTVGTHRHGCCVLQRCVDHASGIQKAQLIAQISLNAYVLVQDPFGNYVVQYILDINEPLFTEPVIHCFLGRVPALSKQKFSSNVIEKCLRVAEPSLRQKLIEEILEPQELSRLLRDQYANYVVQTAMDFADPITKAQLVENIRPILPAIRSTPYGRRIQGKVNAIDGRSGGSSGQMTPNETPGLGLIPLAPVMLPPPQSFRLGLNNPLGPAGTFANVHPGQNQADIGAGGAVPASDNTGSAPQAHTQISSIFPSASDNNTPANAQQPFISAYGEAPPSHAYYF